MRGKGALDYLPDTAVSEWNQQPSIPDVAQDRLTNYSWTRHSSLWFAALTRASSLRYSVIKRGLDIVLSSFFLILLFPLGFLVALLVKLTSPGPVFYRQERVGRFGIPFRIIKFRSMYINPHRASVIELTPNRFDRQGFTVIKMAADPRITPFGRLIRRLSLDELPQLINVLIGDMSLVGPRPIIDAERPMYGRNLPYYDLVCPGITGLWQVSGRSNIGYEQRVLLDRQYASQWSCLLDLIILLRTIPAVITMKGAY
ncbi:MAG TPA: sugar transferase [Terracidiphilus sp.]|nr:sugar transferase [Terracidiphilus sp.]